MKKTDILFPGSFRVAAALCLLPALLAASPAKAGPAAPPQERAAPNELAGRVGDRAAFAAAIAPKLTPLLQESFYGDEDGRERELLVERLWLLRFAPDVQKKWLEELTAPTVPPDKRHAALRQFDRFMEVCIAEADSLARERNATLWSAFRNALRGGSRDAGGGDTGRSLLTAERIEKTKAWEKAFADALLLYDIYVTAELDPYDAKPYITLLLGLKNRDDRLLAASLIQNGDMAVLRKKALLQKLAEDPAGAREAIAEAGNTAAMERRYLYATRVEGDGDAILLPLKSVLPEAEQALEKCDVVPLAASPKKQKTLVSRQRDRLVPECFAFQDKDGALSALPFLEEGERLYLLLPDWQGASIFRQTPLEALAYVGPRVVEYTGENRDVFLPVLGGGEPSRFWELPVLLAAKCGPEELAAHLGGLAVMAAKRERSLYGPFEDFVHNPAGEPWSPYSRFDGKDFPRDTRGEALRLVQVTNPVLIQTLAPLADKDGLARLMGPIRGVWARSGSRYAASPWTEMRYTPKAGSAKIFPLGEAPVLSLDNKALEALVAARERVLLHAWAAFAARETCRDDERLCAEQYPAALAEMERKFAAMRAKGFVSPFDMGAAAYLLEKTAKDGRKREELRAILDDTSLSSAKRVRAMRAASREQ